MAKPGSYKGDDLCEVIDKQMFNAYIYYPSDAQLAYDAIYVATGKSPARTIVNFPPSDFGGSNIVVNKQIYNAYLYSGESVDINYVQTIYDAMYVNTGKSIPFSRV